MNYSARKGFTLIEILIVVAIIAILASVVLVGLGPTQQLGRDSRRVSDLHEVQNGLELYYNKNGHYPNGEATWAVFQTDLTGAGVGITAVPNDPSSGHNYIYAWTTGGAAYELEATMENNGSSVWSNYTAPVFTANGETGGTAPTCAGPGGATPDLQYCITL